MRGRNAHVRVDFAHGLADFSRHPGDQVALVLMRAMKGLARITAGPTTSPTRRGRRRQQHAGRGEGPKQEGQAQMPKGRLQALLGQKGKGFPANRFPRNGAQNCDPYARRKIASLAQLLHLDAKMPARQVEEGRLDELIGPQRRGAGIGGRISPARFGVHQPDRENYRKAEGSRPRRG